MTKEIWYGDKEWASESVTCSFKLTNREKTYTNTSIESCYENFLDNYGEALDELSEVVIDSGAKLEENGKSITSDISIKMLKIKLVIK